MPEPQTRLFTRAGVTVGTVAIERIKPPDNAPRSATGASIEALGFTSTILLRPLLPDLGQPWDFEIVDGSRRYRDAIEQGINEVPATILPAETDDTEAHALRASMNLNRRPNPVAEAHSLHQLRETYRQSGMSEQDIIPHISRTLGFNQAVVEQRLRIFDIPQEIREAVLRGEVAPGVAANIANLRADQQQELVERLNESGKLTGADVSRVRLARKQQQAATLPFDLFESDEATDTDSPPIAQPPAAPLASPEQTARLREQFTATAAALIRSGETVRSLRELLKQANARARSEQ